MIDTIVVCGVFLAVICLLLAADTAARTRNREVLRRMDLETERQRRAR